jgi:hypothetical protein
MGSERDFRMGNRGMNATKRVIRVLQRRLNGSLDRDEALSVRQAIGLVTRANPEDALRPRVVRKCSGGGSWDRWANGNQYGSYSSDED